MQVVQEHSGGNYSVEEILTLEMKILLAVNFKLNFTTPYDYAKPFFEYFPWLTQLKKIVPMIIDLAITLPQSASYSSEELFFGSFLAAVNIKQYQLNDIQQQVLEAHIPNQNRAVEVSTLIQVCYINLQAAAAPPDGNIPQNDEQKQ